jgi:hypothetical protein
MNPAEQKRHTSITDGLRDDLAIAVETLDTVATSHENLVKGVDELRAGHDNRLSTLDTQIRQIDTTVLDLSHRVINLTLGTPRWEDHAELSAIVNQFLHRRFWSRMNWLITGR